MPQNASAGPSLLHRQDAMTQQRGIAFAQAIRLDEVSALREQRGAAGEFCLVGRQPPKHTGSALTCIAGLGRLPEVKARIERNGEDVNSKDSNGETPLAAASAAGDEDMCTYLISAGADVLAASTDGMTALHLAAREGHVHIVRLLASTPDFYRPDLDLKTADGWTSLHMAARQRHASVVRYLVDECSRTELQMEVNINARTSDGRTALMIAAENGFLEGASILLEQGADASLRCWEQRYSALHLAAITGHADVVGLLLDRNAAAADERATGEWTPLMLAASRGHTSCMTALLVRGARPDATNASGSISLEIAAQLSEDDEAIELMASALQGAFSVTTDSLTETGKQQETATEGQEGRLGACEASRRAVLSRTNPETIAGFCEQFGLGRLAALMEENDVAVSELLELEEEDWVEMGVAAEDLRALMCAIQSIG